MRNLISLLTLLFVVITISSCSTKGGYLINGDIKNSQGIVYLSILEGKMPKIIDSTEVVDGKFTFKGTLDNTAYAQIQEKGSKYPFVMFFIENSPITLVGDKNKNKEIVVSGSNEHDLFQKEYLPAISDLEASKKFVKSNPQSIAAAYVLFRHLVYQLPISELEELRESLNPEIKESSYIQILDERLTAMKKSEVGQKYMNISLPDTSGNDISLSSIVDKGGYVLLDFWASWCPPCRADNPNLVKLYNKYSSKGFTIYGVSLDRPDGKEDWIKAINDDGLTWINVSDLKFWECGPAAEYGVNSIPSNFLISPEGIIVAKNLKGDGLDKKLEELLGEDN